MQPPGFFNIAKADAGFTAKPSRLHWLANAVMNHARPGNDVNCLDRASLYLLAIPHLPKADRARLQGMRRQYLPR